MYSNKLVRLCQGVGKGPTNTGQHIKGTFTFPIICFADIPHNRRKVSTFTKVVCKFCPNKEDPNNTRIIIMGNRVVYAGDAGTKTTSLNLCKLVINSVLSCKESKFITYYIRNYYLATPLNYPEYLKSSSPISLKISLTSITYKNTYTRAGCILRSVMASMVSLSQAYLPMTS